MRKAKAQVKPSARLPKHSSRSGQYWLEPRNDVAAAPDIENGDRRGSEAHLSRVAAGTGETVVPVKPQKALSRRSIITDELHDQIGFHARLYWDTQQRRIAGGNRRFQALQENLSPELKAAFDAQGKSDLAVEQRAANELRRWCRQHPLAGWVDTTRGISPLGFGLILGNTGHLDNFANVAKLWAFLGMHVVNGRAPKRAKGVKANWSQRGRMVCHQIAESIVKGGGPYRAIYDGARMKYLARPRLGTSGCPFGHVHRDANGKILQCIKAGAGGESGAHVHAASMRVAIKELLKDMWVAWHKRPPMFVATGTALQPDIKVSPSQSGRANRTPRDNRRAGVRASASLPERSEATP